MIYWSDLLIGLVIGACMVVTFCYFLIRDWEAMEYDYTRVIVSMCIGTVFFWIYWPVRLVYFIVCVVRDFFKGEL